MKDETSIDRGTRSPPIDKRGRSAAILPVQRVQRGGLTWTLFEDRLGDYVMVSAVRMRLISSWLSMVPLISSHADVCRTYVCMQ